MSYSIIRFYAHHDDSVILRGLTLEEAKLWCTNPETSSRTCKSPVACDRTKRMGPWFDGYHEEEA